MTDITEKSEVDEDSEPLKGVSFGVDSGRSIKGFEVSVFNPEPQYIILDNFISQDFAEKLMELVDKNGVAAEYGGNPNTIEYRVDMSATGNSEDAAVLTALHKLFYPFQSIIPQLFRNTAMDFITGNAGFWIMKYDEGGQFTTHVDWSMDGDKYATQAVATLCIRLNDEYEGGERELAGKEIGIPLYGGIIHDGWTSHKVNSVTSGSRYVILTHYTGVLKD